MSDAFIPLCAPEIRGNEWRYVKDCLDTGWVSSVGQYVNRFEQELAQRAGCPRGVASVNGTSALHLALLCAGVRPDDDVLVSTLTFIAPVNVIRYVGAWPAFVDAEARYWQMDARRVELFLREQCVVRDGAVLNRRTGRRVAALLPVHVLGHPVDLDPILRLGVEFGLPVIEDATEGLGALYQGKPIGGLADAGCFSFNGNKLITTGGGGAMVTRRADWADRAKYLSTQAKDSEDEYIHHEVGFNYRLTNLQAAMGCAQLEQLDAYVEAKRAIAKRYADGLSGIPGIEIMREAPWATSAYWMYTVLVRREAFGMDSRALMRRLKARGIQTRPLWEPIHLSRAHRSGDAPACPVAEELFRDALSLPCSVGLAPEAQDRVIDEMISAFRSVGSPAAAPAPMPAVV